MSLGPSLSRSLDREATADIPTLSAKGPQSKAFSPKLRPMRRSAEPLFLHWIARFERVLARVLACLLGVVLIAGTLQLVLFTAESLFNPDQNWLEGGLIRLLDHLLLLLIGLEVLQNVTAYLRDHSIHTELVLLTAITAVARKVIVMPPGQVKDPLTLVGVGVVVLCMASAFLLIRNHTLSLPDPPPRADDLPDDESSSASRASSTRQD